jgi:2-polyprenyl-3-methyl-5-hydroxy-6-metoxy-1,4-benzoquinol methylase
VDIEQANIERFNEIAAQWDEEPGRVKMAQSIASSMLAAVEPTGTEEALEFGCGTGLVTLSLAPRLARITAMDSSAEMLNVLRGKRDDMDLDNVATIEGSVPDQLPEGRFDLIVSSMTLHHVGDIEALLQALFGHLAPGGHVALADLDAEDGSFHGDQPGIAHHGFRRDVLEAQLAAAGFTGTRFSHAYTLEKESAEGGLCGYSVFLAVAARPAG